ncbi:MAG TPA: SUF system NifU family Fe-S cluster assembly protein [Patescibacteria group bacterium]|nr:SUF system NifU family Fe-S cluster assembly protein [Patescibacteria group bacterium]
MSDLYQEVILDHAQHPHNFGSLEHPTHTIKDANASCGDMVEMYLVVKNGKITDVKWRGIGCAISTASASMVSDLIKGKSIASAKALTKEKLMKEMGLDEILPTREKCLVLPLRVLQHLP